MALPTSLDTGKAGSSSGVSPILSNTSAFLDLLMGTQTNRSGGSSTVTSGSVDTQESSGGSVTKKTDVSAEGIDSIVRKLMEGVGGLADVATGAHTAGVYGDTTQVNLVQNLLTKIAGQAAEINAPTTTTTSPTTVTSTTGPKSAVVTSADKTSTPPKLTGNALLTTLLGTGASVIGSRVLKKSGLLDYLGLGDEAASAGAGASGYDGSSGSIFDNMSDFVSDRAAPEVIANSSATASDFSGASVASSRFADELVGGATGDATAAEIGAGFEGLDLVGGAAGGAELANDAIIGSEAGATGGASLAGEIGVDALAGSGSLEGLDFLGGASGGLEEGAGALGGFLADGDTASAALSLGADAAFGPAFAAINLVSGGDAGEMAGEAVSEIGGSFIDALSGIGDNSSIVCYELVRTGGMRWEYADASSRFARDNLPHATIKGYHYLCPWLLHMMRTHNWAYKIIQSAAVARSEELVSGSLYGKIVRVIFEPICFVVGHTFGRKAPLTFNISEVLGRMY